MFNSENLAVGWASLANRFQARRAALARPVTAFISQPEPRTIGSFARGRQLSAGNFVFAGHLVQQPDTSIWNLPSPDPAFEEELHGFVWLDDLAAVGDAVAREKAQSWLKEWITRFGRGRGPGWTPELTGRRLIRWINHAFFVVLGRNDTDISGPFYRLLAQQTIFLGRRWRASRPGLARFEALTGLIYASLSLEGLEAHLDPAISALGEECDLQIDAEGGLPTRNPEDLLEVFTLLNWAAVALQETGRAPDRAHWGAIERIAPALRTLRHADGGLARFHGGGRGLEGRLDNALAASGVKTRQPDGLSMGYARLSTGRTSVIIDAAPPPAVHASANAHASTLAFELTSGRRPLIVNCGSGASFGRDWRRAGRATPSHSTLVLASRSSARLGTGSLSKDWLSDAPGNVPVEVSQAPDGLRFEGAHDGYAATHGLTHIRKIEMTFDGRAIAGEDMLLTLDDAQKARFDEILETRHPQGIPFDLRFHLHPDVDVALDLGGTTVSMALKSGEIWIFRGDGLQDLSVDVSVYLEKNRLKPRATKQIVLSGVAMQYATRIRWSLAKAQDTPVSIRDLQQEALEPVAED